MENTFKRNIQKLLIFMLTAAVIPLFWLLGPLLPSPLSGIVLLLLTVGWILFCFFETNKNFIVIGLLIIKNCV